MVGVVALFVFLTASSLLVEQTQAHVQQASNTTSEATQYVINTMCASPTGMDADEFELLWEKIFGEEGNHTLVPVNGTNYTQCNTSQFVFIEHDGDESNYLEPIELESAMTRMWTMTLLCEEEHEEHEEVSCEGTTAEIWGFSILANFIISMLSMIGVLSVPFSKSPYFKFILHFFLALSAGTMFGDALIHIIPAMMGLHSHSEEEAVLTDGHAHEEVSHEDETPLDILYEITPLVLTAIWILFFFLLEKVIVRVVGHQHHNHLEELELDDSETDSKSSTKTDELPVDSTDSTSEESKKRMIHPAGYLLLIGDGTHNFVDGLAIGLAFSSSFDLGLATSIAVLVHEVPQEFGDFALLINSGFSRKEALLFNLLSGFISLIGSLVGCGIGSIGDADRYILPVVAGSFFYISLCDIVPILHHEARKHSWKTIFLQTAGIVLGIGIMMIIAIFEDIPVSLCGESAGHDDHGH